MDLVLKCVEMCAKAEELQKRWQIQGGDAIGRKEWRNGKWRYRFLGFAKVLSNGQIIQISPTEHKFEWGKRGSEGWIWIPTLEQLQEIALWRYKNKEDMLTDFRTFLSEKGIYISDHLGWYDSDVMQVFLRLYLLLWIMFVMDRKYKKKWNDGEWVAR